MSDITAPVPEIPSFLKAERLAQAVNRLTTIPAGPDRLTAGAELVTAILEDLALLEQALLGAKVALDLVVLPDDPAPPQRAVLLPAGRPTGKRARRRALAAGRATRGVSP